MLVSSLQVFEIEDLDHDRPHQGKVGRISLAVEGWINTNPMHASSHRP